MTALGLVFAVVFAVGALRGRRGLALALACAVPFNDSAMIVAGPVVVTPFYAGLLLYAGWSLLQWRRPESVHAGLLVALFGYAAVVTLLAPAVFGGLGVIAAGGGLDEQFQALTPLSYTSSNVAQLVYLGLGLALVYVNGRDGHVGDRYLALAFTVGLAAAAAGYAAKQGLFVWPTEFFDNSPRNFYAAPGGRLRSQFAEPSHLGAFTVPAVLFFTVRAFQTPLLGAAVRRLALAFVAGWLLIESNSGTATLGVLITVGLIVVVGIVRAVASGGHTPAAPYLAGLVAAAVLVLVSPRIVPPVMDLILEKQASVSFTNRGFANGVALDLLQQTFYVGTGLGSNRSSSLLLQLLSTIGVIGTGLFLWLLWRCAARSLGEPGRYAALCALTGLVVALFVSYPDLASPVLWSLVAVCYRRRIAAPPEDDAAVPVRSTAALASPRPRRS